MDRFQQFVYPPGWSQPSTPREILANSPDVYNTTSLSRMMFTRIMDPRRNIEDECGYPRYGDRIDVELFRQLYDRDPIANRAIQCLPKEAWQVTPKVYEAEGEEPTEFEKAWDELEVGLTGGGTWFAMEEGSSIWSYLLRADILSGIGGFGVLLLGLDDGQPLHTPAEGMLAPTTNSSTPLDSPLTDDEERMLLKPAARRVWTGRTNSQTKRRIVRNVTPPKLNDAEKAILNEWRQERERVHTSTRPTANCTPGQMRDPDTGRCGHGVGLDVSRSEMPQIRSEDMKRFIDYARSQNVGVANDTVACEDLSPIQKEFKQERVDAIPDDNDTPLLIDADDRILDGTHRWVKRQQAGKKSVDVIRIDLPTDEALELMHGFEGVNYVENMFCATGEGGGVDPSCSPDGGGGNGGEGHAEPAKVETPPHEETWQEEDERLRREAAGKPRKKSFDFSPEAAADPLTIAKQESAIRALRKIPTSTDNVGNTVIKNRIPYAAKAADHDDRASKAYAAEKESGKRVPTQEFDIKDLVSSQEHVSPKKLKGMLNSFDAMEKGGAKTRDAVEIFKIDGKLYVGEGNTRISAMMLLGRTKVRARFYDTDKPSTNRADNAGGPYLDPATVPRGSGVVPEPKGRPTRPGATRDGKTVADLTGTDLQYSWQLQPPQSLGGDYPANPNGTDSQYFGVQFGPSEQPADEAPPKSQKRKLLFLRPFDESLVQIVRYEWNLLNPRFSMPVMYRITLNDPREAHSGIGLPMATVFVHWSRVIHITDTNGIAGSSEVFSAPRLRPVMDRIYDLRKIYGAAGEAYWKAAFHILQFSTHAQLGGDVEVNVPSLRDNMEQVDNGLQRMLLGRGGEWSAIAPTATDPTPFVTMAMEAICIQMGIPVRVFKGSERGELASSQDDSAWNDRLRHRQGMYLTPRVVVPFIDRLIQLGVLPEPKTKPASQGGDTPQNADNDEESTSKSPPPTGAKPPTPAANRFGPLAPRTYGRVEIRHSTRVLVRNADGDVEEKDASDMKAGDTPLATKTATEKVVKADAPAGYHIEWPDLDSLSDKDKAGIFLQRTQAWAAYTSGGLENVIPPETFASEFDQMTEEAAAKMIADTTAAHAAEDTMTTPPMISGRPAEAPPGTQDAADAKTAQDQAKAQLDLKAQQIKAGGPPGASGGKPPGAGGAKPPGGAKPNGKPPVAGGVK